MNKKLYFILVIISALFCAFLSIFILKRLPAGVIGGILGGLVTAYALKGYIKKEIVEAVKTATQTSNPKTDLRIVFKKLLELNIAIRTKGFPVEALSLAENVIDLLVQVIPDMQERYSGEELTWETLRMAEKHLPDLISFFGNLSFSDREKQQSKLIESLSSMKNELEEISQLVKNHQTGEFERKAATVKMKYPC